MLIISLATAGTVLTLNTYKKGDDDEPVPELLQKIFFDIIARIFFMKVKVNRNAKKVSFEASMSSQTGKRLTKTSPTYEIMSKSLLLKEASPYRQASSWNAGNQSINSSNIILNSLEKESLILKSKSVETQKSDPKSNEELVVLQNASSQQHKQLKRMAKLMKNLSVKLERHERSCANQKNKQEIKVQWTELARVVDRLLFFIFSILVLFVLRTLFYYSARKHILK